MKIFNTFVKVIMMKVSVIGAGPSGCIAAASALEEGYNATIYEEHKEIGLPEQCGGLLSKSAIEWFSDKGINYKKTIKNKIFGAELHSGKTKILIKDRTPKAFVVKRSSFDLACANFAEHKGAEIKLNHKLTSNQISQLSKSSFIIGADGPHSTVAKTFRFPEIKHYAIAYQKDITNLNLNKQEKHLAQVYLHEKAFGWLIPLSEERAHVGMIFFQNPEVRKFDWFLEEICSKIDKNKLKTENFFADIVPFSIRPKIQKKNVYLVGDAAGQVKATSGGGIYYGCRSAWLAGKTIGSGAYEKRWKSELGNKLEQHLLARKVINTLNGNVTSRLLSILEGFGIEHMLRRYDMENISSLVRL